MGVEKKTNFTVDKSKCIRCGKCIDTCSGMVIEKGKDGFPEMKSFERFGWRGCWRCQHCLAVCPVGAMLDIPNDHYTKLLVGFGYPEIEYARGVQKERKQKIHRYSERR